MSVVVFRTVLMLFVSNVLMTVAWYGHLGRQHREKPVWMVIPVAWGIAFFEYCLVVPANRLAYGALSAFQLKIIQEVLTLVVFVVFAWWYLKEPLRWNHGVAFVFLALAVFFAFAFKGQNP